MSNVQLNTDVYACVLSFVSSPSDLLAFGLANKNLLALAEPEMIYRSIRCKLGHDEVWEHFIINPAQASRVRELEIMRENPSWNKPYDHQEIIPGIHDDEPSKSPSASVLIHDRHAVQNSELLMIQAIHNMVNLESLTWDSWVPEVNQGEEVLDSWETHKEDVWTALRDYTPLKKLKVVDLGRVTALFSTSRPIFESTIFTLGNLTHLDLKMYYSPAVRSEGAQAGYGCDDDSDEELIPPRIMVERIQDLLSRCPAIEDLSLTIIDRHFYDRFGGNPFTNISVLISLNHFHYLTSLKLHDVTINDSIMVTFLNTHPGLRTLSASLSMSEEDLPELPFSLETNDHFVDGVLPNLELVHLPPRDLRILLRAIRRPSSLHCISILEPADWNASEELENDENYVSSLDDVWGVPLEGMHSETGPLRGKDLQNLLTDMPNLRKLEVQGVKTALQVQKLVRTTPRLEHVTFHDCFIHSPLSQDPHTNLVPYLSRWPRLVSLKGNILWPMGYNADSERILSILQEISAACPLLREVTWVDGRSATITRTESGEARLELHELQDRQPIFDINSTACRNW